MSTRARVLSLALAILVMAPVVASAQTTMTAGLKGGVNSSTITDEGNSSLKRLLGGVGGVFVGGDVNGNVGIQVEGLYSMRGAKDNSDATETTLRTNYIDVPVTLRFGAGSGSGMGFHVFTGPQVSYLLDAKATHGAVSVDLKDDLEKIDFGWTLGVGMEANRFLVDARYTHGLKNMSKTGTGADSEVKNRTFAVMIGFRLK